MSISGINSQHAYAVTGNAISMKETLHARKMTESEVTEAREPLSIQKHAAQQARNADNAPENLFAEIKVNGKVVAKVWDSGLAQTPRDLQLSTNGGGLPLAQERAEQIAKELGGEINYSTKPSSYSFSDSLAQILNSYHDR
ncbi:hypothetical protein QT231_22010 [Halomonas sp. SpR1]|uniref:hypothetical protein n=1 Tax=Halomonas sp. SpR1 TaxID=3050462 RepID=UPI0027E3BE1B|nr:hypothetical protein [Halomonas sp. SpR1]MDQ7735385.1 hypothetical protein [Halomonas sp. SpR1]